MSMIVTGANARSSTLEVVIIKASSLQNNGVITVLPNKFNLSEIVQIIALFACLQHGLS